MLRDYLKTSRGRVASARGLDTRSNNEIVSVDTCRRRDAVDRPLPPQPARAGTMSVASRRLSSCGCLWTRLRPRSLRCLLLGPARPREVLRQSLKQICLGAAVLALLCCVSCVTRRYEVRGDELVPLQRTRRPLRVKQDVATPQPAQEAGEQAAADNFDQEAYLKAFLKDCRKEPNGKLTKFYRALYQDAGNLASLLESWKGKETRLVAYHERNMLLITDTEESLKNIASVLHRLDCETPQVHIKVRIVEISASSDLEYGLEYTQNRTTRGSLLKNINAVLNPKNYLDSEKSEDIQFQGATFGLFTSGKHSGDVDITIRMLQERTNAEILSCPDIFVENGATATLHTGEEVPYQEVSVIGTQTQYFTKFRNVGVQLMVKPLFVGDDAVRLNVKPEVSSLTGWTDPSVTKISNPIISTRNCSTTVTVEGGETIVIAGLLENRRLLVKRSLPLIGDIPLLGYLFSSFRYEVDKTQLLFFLTIEIVHPGRPENRPKVLEPDKPGQDLKR